MEAGIINRYSENSNAIEFLRLEYNRIWKLCDICRNMLQDNSAEDRTKVAHELCRMASLCNLVEQEVLYPEVRKINEENVFDLLLSHDDINACILEVRALSSDDMDFDLEVTRLIDTVYAHIRESEVLLFPVIEREIPADRLRLLAADFIRRSLLLHLLTTDNGEQHAPRSGMSAAVHRQSL